MSEIKVSNIRGNSPNFRVNVEEHTTLNVESTLNVSQSSLPIPAGSTEDRNVSNPVEGSIRLNTDTNTLEVYHIPKGGTGQWCNINSDTDGVPQQRTDATAAGNITVPEFPVQVGSGNGLYLSYNSLDPTVWFITYHDGEANAVAWYAGLAPTYTIDTTVRLGDSNVAWQMPSIPKGTRIVMWGAGGGADRASDDAGGTGGFSEGITTQVIENAYFIVGQGGSNTYGHTAGNYLFTAISAAGGTQQYSVGGGWPGNYGSGGGCSGLFFVDPLTIRDYTSTIICAGGGGGGIGQSGYTIGGGDGGGVLGENGAGNAGGGNGQGGGRGTNYPAANSRFFYANHNGSLSCTSRSGGGYISGEGGAGGCSSVYGAGAGGSGYVDDDFVAGYTIGGRRSGATFKKAAFTNGSDLYLSPIGEQSDDLTPTGKSSGDAGGHGIIILDFNTTSTFGASQI